MYSIILTSSTYNTHCDTVAAIDPDLYRIIQTYGYPPLWSRPNTFETFVRIILEQQVSLASALSAYQQLQKLVGIIIPENVIHLSDEQFKSAYVSRQKARYIRGLAEAIINGFDLGVLADLSDDEVRARLIRLKGIGHWTIDIYLIMVLHRADIFPYGDVAAMKALRELKGLDSKDDITGIVESWRPHRTAAALLLWHYYLSVRKREYL